ncbi:stress response protein SCP2 [Streptacidiphilus sp. EB129]
MTTVLTPGGNTPLSSRHVAVEVVAARQLDVSALLLAGSGKVRSDADMVFFNAPNGPGVSYSQAGIAVDTGMVPADVARIVITASLDDQHATFAGTEPTATVRDTASGAVLATFTPPRLSQETALIVVELYRRGPEWKLRAVGQGYANGLAGIATDFGVSVDDAPQPAPTPPVQPAPAAPFPSAAPPLQPSPPAPFQPSPAAPFQADPAAPFLPGTPPPLQPTPPTPFQPATTLPAQPPATAPFQPSPAAPFQADPAAPFLPGTPPPLQQPTPAAPFQPATPPAAQPGAAPLFQPGAPIPFPSPEADDWNIAGPAPVPFPFGAPAGSAPAAPAPTPQPPAPPTPAPMYAPTPAPAPTYTAAAPAPPAPAAIPEPAKVTLDKGRVSLAKGGSVSLTKNGRPFLSSVRMGLGWEPAHRGRDIDLDASVLAFDAHRKHLETVMFSHLQAFDGAIQHAGDNLTGDGAGDDETITVHLQSLPPQVTGLVFTVNSYSGQRFTEVAKAYCRLIDATTGAELVRFDLTHAEPHTGVMVCKLIRMLTGEWVMTAIEQYEDAKTARGMTVPAAHAL